MLLPTIMKKLYFGLTSRVFWLHMSSRRWAVIGDFNEKLYSDEKCGRKTIKNQKIYPKQFMDTFGNMDIKENKLEFAMAIISTTYVLYTRWRNNRNRIWLKTSFQEFKNIGNEIEIQTKWKLKYYCLKPNQNKIKFNCDATVKEGLTSVTVLA